MGYNLIQNRENTETFIENCLFLPVAIEPAKCFKNIAPLSLSYQLNILIWNWNAIGNIGLNTLCARPWQVG
mgnify:CR=1 FL=1